jgi:hypothetical protein
MLYTINIGAILILLYTYKHMGEFSLQVTENSTISRTVVSILTSIPKPSLMIITLMLIILISLWTKSKWRYLGYGIATIILDIGLQIGLSELALEPLTKYYVLAIYHPIPIETKLIYLEKEIAYCYSQIIEELSAYSYEQLANIKTYIENNINETFVLIMNAQGLSEYARSLVIEGFDVGDNKRLPIQITENKYFGIAVIIITISKIGLLIGDAIIKYIGNT